MKKISLLFAILFANVAVFGQYTNILIDNSGSPNEPSICVNPHNTNQVVAGANSESYYYSDDAGMTWSEGFLVSTENGVYGDPCIAADRNGDFYYFHLANPPAGNWGDRIVCQKSTNGGSVWDTNGSYTGLNGGKVQDKEWVSIDRTNNNIYVTWTQFDAYNSSNPNDSSIILFSKSVDAGITWSTSIRLSQKGGDCVDDDNTTEGAVPAVGPNGEIYVAWAGKKPDGTNAIMFDKSTDFGETWLNQDIYVTDFPGGWAYDIPGIYRANGLPVTACDTSGGAYNGTVYINWTDQRNGTSDTDVWLAKSTDGGQTWSAPIRVNDDAPGKQQFFTWMAIDQTNGKLYFVFYDRRNYSNTATDVYMAVSEDGGTTFNNFKISETPFVPSSSIFFGDYTNISVHDGVIRPIWARADGSNMSLYTAIIENGGSQIPKIENDLVNNEEIYPNPFKNEIYFSFKIRKNTNVSLKVYDILGNEVCTIINKQTRTTGKYVETFKPEKYNVPEGVYYFKFTSDNKILTRKIVFQK